MTNQMTPQMEKAMQSSNKFLHERFWEMYHNNAFPPNDAMRLLDNLEFLKNCTDYTLHMKCMNNFNKTLNQYK